MKNEPARLTEISLCSAGISARRADFFPYDSSSSPANRAEKLLFDLHLPRKKYKQTLSRDYSGGKAGLKIPYDSLEISGNVSPLELN